MFCNNKRCRRGKLVKILPASGSTTNTFGSNTLHLTGITSSRELDQYVVLESHMYEKIFDEKKISAKASRKRLSVVKISSNGVSIYRAYLSAPASGFGKDYVALTPNSIYELSQCSKIPMLADLTLRKGSPLKYYWNSPNAAERMSFRMGVLGIAATIILSCKEIWELIRCCCTCFH